MTHIGVFLSSYTDLPQAYLQAADDVARWIGSTGRTLVYGGSRCGLMERLATGVHAHGGKVMGIVPQILVEKDLVSTHLDYTLYTADLNDRKAALLRESDILIALPGGIGTLDEVFTALSAESIGLRSPHVVLYNADGCWDSLIALLDELYAKGLTSGTARQLVSVVDSIDGLTAVVEGRKQ